MHRVGFDNLHEPTVVLLVLNCSFQQGFCEPANGSQRCAKFMRHIGHKIPSYGFQFLETGNVVQDRNSTGWKWSRLIERHCDNLKNSRCAEVDFDSRLSLL